MSGHGPSGPSTKSLYLIFIATFVFGMVSGVIIFLQSNTGDAGNVGSVSNTDTMTIAVYAYGGCARGGCASYQITSDGAYTYLVRDPAGGEKRITDTLSQKQFTALEVQLADVDLPTIQASEFNGTCPITFDGIAYRYDITYQGVQYSLDSCVHDVEGNAFFDTLTNYFEIFALVQNVE